MKDHLAHVPRLRPVPTEISEPFHRGQDEPPPHVDIPDDEPLAGNEAATDTPPQSARDERRPFSAGAFSNEEAPPRRWFVRDRIPMAAHTLFSGDGAAGKTLTILQLCHASAAGRGDWLGGVIDEPGPALFVTGEEDRDELHRRLGAINRHFNNTFADIADLHLFSLPGEDVVLATTGADGIVRPTAFYHSLEMEALRIGAKVIAIEAAADVFAGNESARPEVRQFGQIMRRLAIKVDAAVILVQHPSVTGLAAGDGRSGSTHWRNSFRAQLHLAGVKRTTQAQGQDEAEGDSSDQRTLTVGKSNYGPAGEKITLRWERGVFVPEGTAPSLERMAAERDVDEAFLRCLDAKTATGVDVSPAQQANNYAPKMFEGMAQAAGIRKRAFVAAMIRLEAGGRITREKVGPASRQTTRMVRAEPGAMQ